MKGIKKGISRPFKYKYAHTNTHTHTHRAKSRAIQKSVKCMDAMNRGSNPGSANY